MLAAPLLIVRSLLLEEYDVHAVEEYRKLLRAILAQAEQITMCLPPEQHAEATSVLDFLKAFGCAGYPTGRTKDFSIGQWIFRKGKPTRQRDGLTIVPCFHDDVPPIEPPPHSQLIVPGACFYSDQTILLYNVDHWSLVELALTTLHEGRHARHRIGPTLLAGLPPLDHADVHETNTWLFMLNALCFWGDAAWDAAVQQERKWLERQPLVSERPDQILFTESGHYWPELDQVFGPTPYADARTLRQRLASVCAHMLYWPRRHPALSPEQVCHSLLRCFHTRAD